ncbi:hypothetical protein HBH70_026580 [Parastagonospora nodorum]|nr:hypothetical protein HBH46_194700 [Parastagonospora nodorum]KAH4111638.1 hypothetical protein HBH47_239470 [Parastagonospora nodorum]KAH5148447.1 hypothetical protein HBH70_026580 [Parastagonospora nodorum]KAH5168108.1 hypothetical protein HBH77_239770 [Parastagonospora nodorum]KAH5209985.1 hypothetical protein HBH68_075800 [Parastagonospora nodorum]
MAEQNAGGSGNKRGRYVSQACLECQKRKTKCSGEDECEQCRTVGVTCAYAPGPARKRRARTSRVIAAPRAMASSAGPTTSNALTTKPNALTLTTNDNAGTTTTPADTAAALATSTALWQKDVTARLGRLETLLGNHGNHGAYMNVNVNTATATASVPVDIGEATLLQPIDALNRIALGGDGDSDSDHESDSNGDSDTNSDDDMASAHCPYTQCDDYPQCCRSHVRLWSEPTRAADAQRVRRHVDAYLDTLNPHYPTLDSREVRAQLDNLLSADDNFFTSNNTLQFAALVHLMVAASCALGDVHHRGAPVPGWQHFLRAQHLLHHATWLGQGNLLTVQCLVAKTLYLVYTEKLSVAYDTVAMLVRLCFQLRLNRPSVDCPSWDAHMRQRVVWSVFVLDRYVAQLWGAPYLLREADMNVPPLNPLSPSPSPSPPPPRPSLVLDQPSAPPLAYFSAMVQWARLSSDVWDGVFSASARQPPSPQFIATMDARITLFELELPSHLRWSMGEDEHANEHALESSREHYHVTRQRLLLHLRANHLRLLLRRDSLLQHDSSLRDAHNSLHIAQDTVAALQAYLKSGHARSSDRHATTLYLTCALISLAPIALRNHTSSTSGRTAITTFNQAIALVTDIAPSFELARLTLLRLKKPRRAILRASTSANPPTTDSVRDVPLSIPLGSTTISTNPPAFGEFFQGSTSILAGDIWDNDWWRADGTGCV